MSSQEDNSSDEYNILDVPAALISDLGSSFSVNTDENSQETLSGCEPVTSAELNVMLSHLDTK